MSDERPTDVTTLGRAKAWLRERLTEGEHCPCCGQRAQTYRRSIHSAMARDLVWCYQRSWTIAGTGKPFHVREMLGHDGGDFAKLAYWGLIAEEPGAREDGGRAGWWSITREGRDFALGIRSVPKYAYVYDGRRLNLGGPTVNVRDCLGKRFDLQELLGSTARA